MSHTGLPHDDVEEVRRRVLAYAFQTGQNYERIATRCRLSSDQVKRFLSRRGEPEHVVAALVLHLPLDLTYVRSRVLPS